MTGRACENGAAVGAAVFGRPMNLSPLRGKGVLVTGGATGAGAAIVRELAKAGAYVTIADNAARQGQQLMLELVSRNQRVQYLFTNLQSFFSTAEAFHYAATFAPSGTLSLIILNTLPPPPLPNTPSSSTTTNPSLLSWLTATPAATTFHTGPPPGTVSPTTTSAPLTAPSTAPLDRAVTAPLHAVHLALHHFRHAAVQPTASFDVSPHVGSSVDKQLLVVAPRDWVPGATGGGGGEDGEAGGGGRWAGRLWPEHLVARAAGAALWEVFAGLRELGTGVLLPEGPKVRVNFVGVEEEGVVDEGAGGEEAVPGKEGLANGVEAASYRSCTDAVLKLACDESFTGRALAISRTNVHEIHDLCN